MILILSKSEFDTTTEDLIDWFFYLNEPFIRLNGEQLLNDIKFQIEITNGKIKSTLYFKDKLIDLSEAGSKIWFRRKYSVATLFDNLKHSLSNVDIDHYNYYHLVKHTGEEYKLFYELFEKFVAGDLELIPNQLKLNKIDVLKSALSFGLQVPDSYVGTSREDVLLFMHDNVEYIIKPLTDVAHFYSQDHVYKMFTKKITKTDISSLDKSCFPFFIQKNINKKFDIRVFYLNGKCYSSAIFSQASINTKVDFRNVDFMNQIKIAPYELNKESVQKIDLLMKSLNLKIGAIDIIKSIDDKDYFLEINPGGQFGFESHLCNYQLEKKLANFLLN